MGIRPASPGRSPGLVLTAMGPQAPTSLKKNVSRRLAAACTSWGRPCARGLYRMAETHAGRLGECRAPARVAPGPPGRAPFYVRPITEIAVVHVRLSRATGGLRIK